MATALAPTSRNRSAGELLAQGVPAAEIPDRLGQAVEALETVPLLARAIEQAGLEAPVTSALARLIDGSAAARRLGAAGARQAAAPARFRGPQHLVGAAARWFAAPRVTATCSAGRASRIGWTMKTEIHPEYVEAHVRCTCGNEFTTRSTRAELHVEICSNCHPFYTGKQKLVDTGGRVERFRRRAARRGRQARLAAVGARRRARAPASHS